MCNAGYKVPSHISRKKAESLFVTLKVNILNKLKNRPRRDVCVRQSVVVRSENLRSRSRFHLLKNTEIVEKNTKVDPAYVSTSDNNQMI